MTFPRNASLLALGALLYAGCSLDDSGDAPTVAIAVIDPSGAPEAHVAVQVDLPGSSPIDATTDELGHVELGSIDLSSGMTLTVRDATMTTWFGLGLDDLDADGTISVTAGGMPPARNDRAPSDWVRVSGELKNLAPGGAAVFVNDQSSFSGSTYEIPVRRGVATRLHFIERGLDHVSGHTYDSPIISWVIVDLPALERDTDVDVDLAKSAPMRVYQGSFVLPQNADNPLSTAEETGLVNISARSRVLSATTHSELSEDGRTAEYEFVVPDDIAADDTIETTFLVTNGPFRGGAESRITMPGLHAGPQVLDFLQPPRMTFVSGNTARVESAEVQWEGAAGEGPDRGTIFDGGVEWHLHIPDDQDAIVLPTLPLSMTGADFLSHDPSGYLERLETDDRTGITRGASSHFFTFAAD